MEFVIKLSFGSDVRRKRFTSVSDVSHQVIKDTAQACFDLSDFIMKYQDEEGDWCTLTPATLPDALDLAGAQSILRLEICGDGGPSSAPATPRSDTSLGSWEAVDFEEEDEDIQMVERDEDMPCEGAASAAKAAEPLVQDKDETVLEAIEAAGGVTHEVETVVPDEELEEPPEGPSAASEEAGMAEQEATAELTTEEKIQTILAAFDANEDGCLNFEESNELQKFAEGDVLDPTVFKIICGELRCSRRGLGAKELRSCYDRFGTLDRDFKAALRKIQSDDAGGKVPGHRTGPEGSNNWSMMVALPLLPVCPVAAAGIALAVSLRNRAYSSSCAP